MWRHSGETALGPPFLVTIFQTVGLNAMDPDERKRDVLEGVNEGSERHDCHVVVEL
jgi:hypothetical protein